MKKILYLFSALVLLLSSCSNEDIPVQTGVTLNVNPYTVISGFQEYSPGELTEIPKKYELRVHMFVYDTNGDLVLQDVQYSPDYSHVLNFKLDINNGNYRVLVLSDVWKPEEEFEYWEFKDVQKLTTLNIESTGFVATQEGIIGYNCIDVTIDGSKTHYDVDMMPAGSLIFVNVQYMKSLSNIDRYQLNTNRMCDNLKFSEYGEPIPSIQSSSTMDWREVILYKSSLSGNTTGLYAWYFTFPVNNATFEFRGIDETQNVYYVLGSQYTCSIGMGEEYSFVLNASNSRTYFGPFQPNGVNLGGNAGTDDGGNTGNADAPYLKWGASYSAVNSYVTSNGFTFAGDGTTTDNNPNYYWVEYGNASKTIYYEYRFDTNKTNLQSVLGLHTTGSTTMTALRNMLAKTYQGGTYDSSSDSYDFYNDTEWAFLYENANAGYYTILYAPRTTNNTPKKAKALARKVVAKTSK